VKCSRRYKPDGLPILSCNNLIAFQLFIHHQLKLRPASAMSKHPLIDASRHSSTCHVPLIQHHSNLKIRKKKCTSPIHNYSVGNTCVNQFSKLCNRDWISIYKNQPIPLFFIANHPSTVPTLTSNSEKQHARCKSEAPRASGQSSTSIGNKNSKTTCSLIVVVVQEGSRPCCSSGCRAVDQQHKAATAAASSAPIRRGRSRACEASERLPHGSARTAV
jgi:hypothetical protein